MSKQTTEPVSTVDSKVNAETLASQPLTAAITLRFYENKTDNTRAPIAYVMLDLPFPLDGTTIEASMFARRDNRGIIQSVDVSMPNYRGTSLFRPMPVFVKDTEGVNRPIEKSADSRGAELFANLPGQITEAFYKWQKDPKGVYTVTLK